MNDVNSLPLIIMRAIFVITPQPSPLSNSYLSPPWTLCMYPGGREGIPPSRRHKACAVITTQISSSFTQTSGADFTSYTGCSNKNLTLKAP